MTTKIPPPAERFKGNIVGMVEFCEGMITDLKNRRFNVVDPRLVRLGGQFLTKIDDENLIEGFIHRSFCHWPKIKAKDEKFFIEHSKEIFGEKVPPDVVDMFVDLFQIKDTNGKNALSQEDRDIIWEFFETFVKISLHYIHERRGPFQVEAEKQSEDPLVPGPIKYMKPMYKRAYMNSDINLVYLGRVWGVTLKFA